MSPNTQKEYEQSIPLLTEELSCSFCAKSHEKFSWTTCMHYGDIGKTDTGKDWYDSIRKDPTKFDEVLSTFLEDTFDAQLREVYTIDEEVPHLLISLGRHAWPLDKNKKRKELNRVPAVQVFPHTISIGDYNSLFAHSIFFLKRLEHKTIHLKSLTLLVYIGSNLTPNFAFNDALAAFLSERKLYWSVSNFHCDDDYEIEGEASPGFHARPNAIEYMKRYRDRNL